MRYDLWFSDGGQAGVVASGEPKSPVRAVLYGARAGQDGFFLSLRLCDNRVIPLEIPLSEKSVRALRQRDRIFFGVIENGAVTEAFRVPFVPACSDGRPSGIDGAMVRPGRAVSPFVSFWRRRTFGEPLHVPEGLEHHAPIHVPDGCLRLAPALAFYAASREPPSDRPCLGRAWRRTTGHGHSPKTWQTVRTSQVA